MNGRGREYASALMEIALSENIKDEMYGSLKTVKTALDENPEYQELLVSPAIPSEERIELVTKAFEGQVHKYVLSLMCVLTGKGHISDFPEAFSSFEEMYLEMSRRTEAVAYTAVELSEDQRKDLKAALEKRFGKEIDIEFKVNANLIGGVVVEMDGMRIDYSLKRRLKEIKEVMEQ